MERLFVLAVMMDVGLCDSAEYEAALDEAFLASPEDPLLLDLEIVSQDRQATCELIAERLLPDPSLLNNGMVENLFLERLERVYRSEGFELDDFATRAYQAWMHLPESLMRSLSCLMLTTICLLSTTRLLGNATRICSSAPGRRGAARSISGCEHSNALPMPAAATRSGLARLPGLT